MGIDQFANNVDNVKRLSLWDELAEIDPSEIFQTDSNDYYFETETNDYFDFDNEYDDDDVNNKEEEAKEMKLRKEWKENDLCLIYSRSKDKWFDGKIAQIRTDEKSVEWLVVNLEKRKNQKKFRDIV